MCESARKDVVGDRVLLRLVGSSGDGQHAYIAHHPLQRQQTEVAVPAEHLLAVERDFDRHFGGMHLGDR